MFSNTYISLCDATFKFIKYDIEVSYIDRCQTFDIEAIRHQHIRLTTLMHVCEARCCTQLQSCGWFTNSLYKLVFAWRDLTTETTHTTPRHEFPRCFTNSWHLTSHPTYVRVNMQIELYHPCENNSLSVWTEFISVITTNTTNVITVCFQYVSQMLSGCFPYASRMLPICLPYAS